MSLVLRNIKGSPLTYTEMDDNLTYLEGVAGATGGAGIFDTLSVSGTSSLDGDLIISSTKVIKSATGGGQLDLDYGGTPNAVALTTDNGGYSQAQLYMEPTYVELSTYYGDIYQYAEVNYKVETPEGGINFGTTSNPSNYNAHIWGSGGNYIGVSSNTIKISSTYVNLGTLPKYSIIGDAGVAALANGTLYTKTFANIGLTYSGTFICVAGA
jgi:hypothetical protein